MTIGNTIDLIDSVNKTPIIIQEGESHNIEGQFVDTAKVNLTLANLTTFVITLYNESDNASINSRINQDAKNVNSHTVATSGAWIVRLDASDSIIVAVTPAIAENAFQYHILRVIWTWNDGVIVRKGIQNIRFPIQKLEVVT